MSKQYADEHEAFIANVIGGRKTVNSGQTKREKADCISTTELVECKYTGEPGKPAKSISLKIDDFNKVFDEAMARGLEPKMALRVFNPDSPAAKRSGWIDFMVELIDV